MVIRRFRSSLIPAQPIGLRPVRLGAESRALCKWFRGSATVLLAPPRPRRQSPLESIEQTALLLGEPARVDANLDRADFCLH
jgi:hypothetical protein